MLILLQTNLVDESTVVAVTTERMNLWTMATYGGPIVIILALIDRKSVV